MQTRSRRGQSRIVIGLVAAMAAAACSGGGDDPATAPETTEAPATTTTSEAPAEPEPEPAPTPVSATATITGDEEMVFDWSESPCGIEARPDLPTAVYRDADGLINLVLSSDINHRLVGPDFESLVPDCEPVHVSVENPDPGQYQFRQWLGALYTDDGSTIHAVVHNEFHGDDASLGNSRRDFSADEDLGGWSYLVRGSSATFDSFDGQRVLPGTICSIAWWGAHPDAGCDPVRRWTAPADGDYSVRLVLADAGIGGGDGVDVNVSRGDETLLTVPIEEGAADRTSHELAVTVTAGDQLDFWVSTRGDASFDATTFEITINPGEQPCLSDVRDQCQMMALTYAQSTDGGASYVSPAPNEHLVATIPEVYEPDSGLVGIWQPSNIVPHPDDGFFYMLAQIDVHEEGRDIVGMCLLRTDDLSSPSSWRAWDGEGFGYEFTDPYAADAEPRDPCPSVVGSPGWSLTYNTYLEQFMMLTETPREFPSGVYFRTSPDLLTWSDPQLLLGWTIGFSNDFVTPFEAYPSLVDPDSEHPSFATVGQTAYLYHSRINSREGILDFDLLRVPVRFDLDE